MKTTIKLAMALAIGLEVTGAAQAATTVRTYEVVSYFETGNTAPINTTFSVSFDPFVSSEPIVTDYSTTGGIPFCRSVSTLLLYQKRRNGDFLSRIRRKRSCICLFCKQQRLRD